MKIAGFDIGGANTDLAIIEYDDKGNIKNIETDFKYLPMWYKNEELGETLKQLIELTEEYMDAVFKSKNQRKPNELKKTL